MSDNLKSVTGCFVGRVLVFGKFLTIFKDRTSKFAGLLVGPDPIRECVRRGSDLMAQ